MLEGVFESFLKECEISRKPWSEDKVFWAEGTAVHREQDKAQVEEGSGR